MSDVSNILAKAVHALREIKQDELADIILLLALLATKDDIALVRGATLRVLETASNSVSANN